MCDKRVCAVAFRRLREMRCFGRRDCEKKAPGGLKPFLSGNAGAKWAMLGMGVGQAASSIGGIAHGWPMLMMNQQMDMMMVYAVCGVGFVFILVLAAVSALGMTTKSATRQQMRRAAYEDLRPAPERRRRRRRSSDS